MPIGGYFSFEMPAGGGRMPHAQGVRLNSGHHALTHLLRALKARRVWMPRFTCSIVATAVQHAGAEAAFYRIGDDLKPVQIPQLGEGDYLIATNYFGLMDTYIQHLGDKLGSRVVIDNAQALYAAPSPRCHQIYSPRKFMGVPDGGIVVSPASLCAASMPQAQAHDICSHLLLRLDGKVAEGYAHFRDNSHALTQQPVSRMSVLTEAVLDTADHQAIIRRRKRNFARLHTALGASNLLRIPGEPYACPLVYPYRTTDETLRQRLIDNQVFVATYWPNVPEWTAPGDTERDLCRQILPLPIDQRYGDQDMDLIINLITA